MRTRGAFALIVIGAAIASSSAAIAKPRVTCPPGKPPDWERFSDSGGFGDFYPVGAGLPPGSVTLSCVAGADGRLYDCEVADEAPAGEGLGLWALHVAHDFRLKRPGCPPAGARFSVPLRFERSG